jgi:hypothetical protein
MIIIFIHKYTRNSAYALISILIVGMTMVNYLVVYNYSIDAYYFFDDRYINLLIHRPWFRLPSFLMGMLLSLIVSRLHSARYKVEFTVCKQAIMQTFGAFIIAISIFSLGFHFIGFKYQPGKGFQ